VCVHIVNTKGSASDLFPTLALKHTFIPIDLMCSVASFCAAGILDRFPNLRVGFFEGGCGWLPWLSSSLDAHVDLLRTQFPWLTRRPSEWIKSQNVSFGIESDDPFLPFAMQEIGTERFMYCSDYAHWDCECPETVSELLSRDDLTDKDKEALACGNASAFFGFDAGQKS
jgi:predicted TIM-barrel fold metal-dependent hydrolase